MNSKLIIRLKTFRLIFIIGFAAVLFLLLFKPDYILLIDAVILGLLVWAEGKSRENTIRTLIFLIAFLPLISLIGKSENDITDIIFNTAYQFFLLIIFMLNSLGKLNYIRLFKKLIWVFTIILLLVLIIVGFNLPYPTPINIIAAFLASVKPLFFAYIVYESLNPEFYNAFVKHKPGTSIKHLQGMSEEE